MSFTDLTSPTRHGPYAGWTATSQSWTPVRAGILSQVVGAVLAWQGRAFERSRVAELSDHTLRDIGLTRADLGVSVVRPNLDNPLS